MRLDFVKMEGCGNDYIYVDASRFGISDPAQAAIKLSDRHFGIGSDGLILVSPSQTADGKMIMYNLDGSEGMMCGNGIRCVGKFLHDIIGGDKRKDILTIETRSGIKTLQMLTDANGDATGAVVDMGKASLNPESIPARFDGDLAVGRKITVGGTEYEVTLVSMGNPHAVIFMDTPVDDIDIALCGPLFEHNELFPEGVNTEFVNVIDKNTLRMRVWERGSGETWACGTGTCASVVAACLNGFCEKGADVLVHLNGGDLVINYTDERVLMSGPCVKVFEGSIEI